MHKEQRRPWMVPVIVAAILLLCLVVAFLIKFFVFDKATDVAVEIESIPTSTPAGEYVTSPAGNDLAYKMLYRPTFKNGSKQPGNLDISNPAESQYDLQVDIYLSDTGKLVYRSGLLEPGVTLKEDGLSESLNKGEYAAQAVFTGYDSSGAASGSKAVEIILVIE